MSFSTYSKFNYVENPNNLDENVKPVITYSNADTQKAQIIEDNRDKSGIYR